MPTGKVLIASDAALRLSVGVAEVGFARSRPSDRSAVASGAEPRRDRRERDRKHNSKERVFRLVRGHANRCTTPPIDILRRHARIGQKTNAVLR